MFPPIFENGFRENGFPINTPLDVAKVILGVVAGSLESGHSNGNVGDEGTGGGMKLENGPEKATGEEIETKPVEERKGPNGLTLYVEGGRAWDIELGLTATQEVWMGKEQSVMLSKVGEWLAMVFFPFPSSLTLSFSRFRSYYNLGSG